MKTKVKLPTLAQMQLGPYKRSEKCGCLMFHADRLYKSQRVMDAIYELDKNELCITHDNTLPNRRAAMSILHKALRQCGYRIARDKKTAVLK